MCQWTFRLLPCFFQVFIGIQLIYNLIMLPCLGCYKSCCCEPRGAHIFSNNNVAQIKAQQWDCYMAALLLGCCRVFLNIIYLTYNLCSLYFQIFQGFQKCLWKFLKGEAELRNSFFPNCNFPSTFLSSCLRTAVLEEINKRKRNRNVLRCIPPVYVGEAREHQ